MKESDRTYCLQMMFPGAAYDCTGFFVFHKPHGRLQQ